MSNTRSFADNFVARTQFVESEVPTLIKIGDSSKIQGISYEEKTEVLTLHMVKGGNVYNYANVSNEQFKAIISAESIGRATGFLNDNEAHPCTCIAKKYQA